MIFQSCVRSLLLLLPLTIATISVQASPDAEQILDNFGLPLSFSTTRMIRDADPASDWARYANGRWIEVAEIPDDGLNISPFMILNRRVERDLSAILTDAASRSENAEKGTPLQQVGDFYASGMDVARIDALGAAPLDEVMNSLDPLDTPQGLGRAFARLSMAAGEPVMAEFAVGTDPDDRSRYAIYLGDADLTFTLTDMYLNPAYEAARKAYLDFVRDSLVIAGTPLEQAQSDAEKILAWEIRIAGAKLTPVEFADPRIRFVPTPMTEVRKLLSNVDLDAFLAEYGATTAPDKVIVVQGKALAERNAMLAEMSAEDVMLFLRWGFLVQTSAFLTTEFLMPFAVLNQAIMGQSATPPRVSQVTKKLQSNFGHPLSQLYVERHFTAASKADVETLVGRIRGVFRDRLQSNSWLTAPTRDYAIEKLDKADILVGYPQEWIDYSGVDIRRDDYYGNNLRTNRYLQKRKWAKLGGPVQEDRFAVSGSTLPIDTNAAFNAPINGIEIPAAFLRPPFYDPDQDAVVNTCAIGAVIGHELTHGFDTKGRLYDAEGRLRDWWTEEDSGNFQARADILIAQASAFELLPGLTLNGELTVSENMADVGAINFALQALSEVLDEHPELRAEKDGLTPEQRCFLAWAQLWVNKSREGALRQSAGTDPHSDGNYRVIAPLQHADEFFAAFDIKAGDPLWIAPDKRARVW